MPTSLPAASNIRAGPLAAAHRFPRAILAAAGDHISPIIYIPLPQKQYLLKNSVVNLARYGYLFGEAAIAMAAPCTYFEVNFDAFMINPQKGDGRHA
jgi:hypothetical protein